MKLNSNLIYVLSKMFEVGLIVVPFYKRAKVCISLSNIRTEWASHIIPFNKCRLYNGRRAKQITQIHLL
jgi:hypothetical protein